MLLSKGAEKALYLLCKNGFEAYIVGGGVRDFLRGVPAHDFDIATNAVPEETKKCFSGFKVIETGLKHGTVSVLINGEAIEITTYRSESGYSDNRHPDSVVFSKSLTEDLARRDFTMNAVAYGQSGEFTDPFGGQADIADKLIRCVGNPEQRFSEDALRILRALRFSSVLSFNIEEKAKNAMFEKKHLLLNISKERILSEFTKMLCGENVKNVLIEFCDIFSVFIPEIALMKNFEQHNPHHIYDVLSHTAAAAENIPPVPHLRLAAFFHDIGKPFCFSSDDKGIGHFYGHSKISADIANRVLTDLKSDTETKNKIDILVYNHDTPILPEEKVIKRKLNKLGESLFFDLLLLQRADNLALSPKYFYRQKTYDEIEAKAQKIIEEKACFSLKSLAINGNDLKNEGFEGKEIGKILNLLLNAVIDGSVKNKKDELLLFAKTESK